MKKIIVLGALLVVGFMFSVHTAKICKEKAQNEALNTFKTICYNTSSSAKAKKSCLDSSFSDFERFAKYSMITRPGEEMDRLWSSYSAEADKCW